MFVILVLALLIIAANNRCKERMLCTLIMLNTVK